MAAKKIYIYGKHAVREALTQAPQIVSAVYLSPQMKDPEIIRLIRNARLDTQRLDPAKATSMVEGNAPHQGIVALVSLGALTIPFEKFLDTYKPEGTSLIFLDGILDPHNVGTIVRAAAAFGASAVLLPQHKQSPITGAVIKASAGAAFSIPLIAVTNTQQTLAELRRRGVAIYGLAGDATESLADEDFSAPTLFVLGNEADGVSGSARALCTKLLRIPISGRVESLNVASAATAALYAWSTRV
ncbi:MAG TPA: 23S rRNA (guanosine(2251)-2'-O)-methyltransferase RlmB [Candidatus Paceibacterota bacterium]